MLLPSTMLVAVAVFLLLSSASKPEPAKASAWPVMPLLVAVAVLSSFLSALKPAPASATALPPAPSLVAAATLPVLSMPTTPGNRRPRRRLLADMPWCEAIVGDLPDSGFPMHYASFIPWRLERDTGT